MAANDEGPPEDLPAVWAAALCDPESHRAQSALQRYEGHLARQLAAAHATFQTLRKTLRASHPPLVFLSDDPEWAEVSEYAYTRDACGGEEWSPDGLMPAHGMAERRKPANDAEEHGEEASHSTAHREEGHDPTEAHPEGRHVSDASRRADREEGHDSVPFRTAEEAHDPAEAHREEDRASDPFQTGDEAHHREAGHDSVPSRTAPSYPPGHEDFGDPLRQRPKMTRGEVAAWRPPGENPKPGNYQYPDGRLRFWPGDEEEGT